MDAMDAYEKEHSARTLEKQESKNGSAKFSSKTTL
jgi:hypothetical protein